MTTSKKTHPARAALAIALAVLCGAPACIVHEPMSYPASPSELARVNAYADDHGLMRVEYEAVLPLCVGEACERERSWRTIGHGMTVAAIRIDPANETTVLLRHPDGGAEAQPLRALNSVSVRNRPRGALQGAGIGAAIGLGVGALFLGASFLWSREQREWGGAEFSCEKQCLEPLRFAAYGGVVGVVTGLLVGARQTFDFERLPEVSREP